MSSVEFEKIEIDTFSEERASDSPSIRNYEVDSKIASMREELNESIEESKSEEDAKVPNAKAIEEANALLQDFLPFEEPISSCLSDGSIVFQWTKRPHSILTLSVCGEGTITYAATFRNEGEKHSGTVRISNQSLSKTLLDFLNSHFSINKIQWINTSRTQNH